MLHPALEQVEHVFQQALGELVVPPEARDRAYRRARAAADALRLDPRAEQIALLDFAEELFAAFAVELCGKPADLRQLIDFIEHAVEIPRVVLGHWMLHLPQLLQLPNAVAIDVELTLILVFADARAASLWTTRSGESLERIAQIGEGDLDAADTWQAASRVLAGDLTHLGSQSSISGVRVDRRQQPPAAVIARGDIASSAERDVLLEVAAPMLGAALARAEPARSPSEPTAPEGAARALSRMRFDLHDGPQQDASTTVAGSIPSRRS
jgi:hypothetical protein